jgi:hypothetical protein
MSAADPPEEFSEQEVTYIAEIEGRLVVIEGVPARVSCITGERFYAPETVERIQAIVWGQSPPCGPSRPPSTSSRARPPDRREVPQTTARRPGPLNCGDRRRPGPITFPMPVA